MITVANYPLYKPNRATLTPVEQEAYDFIESGALAFYDQDQDIRETIDLYLAELNKKEKAATAKPKAAPKPQPAAEEKPFIFFYQNKQVELYASSLYAAKLKAIAHFKAPKSKEHLVHGQLAVEDEPAPTPAPKAAKPRKKLPTAKRPKGRTVKRVQKAPAAPVETPSPKKKATKKLQKAAKAPADGPKRTKVTKHGNQNLRQPVPHFDGDLTLIRQFLSLTKGEVTRKRVKALHGRIEKAIVARKVRKTSPHAALLTDIATLVKKAYAVMVEKDIEKVGELNFSDKGIVQRARAAADQVEIQSAVPLLSRFINMQGTKPEAKTVATLLKAMEKQVRDQPSSDYAGPLKAAVALLKDWKPGAAVRITQHQLSGLNGLLGLSGGLGCPDTNCGCSGGK